ncbi:hypothetical protein DFR65_1201 [Oceanihabitans sediminis]|nr:hypothetical protein DFR65_1201 [Oceanihabitans sediminis]
MSLAMMFGITSCSRSYKIDKTDFSLIPYNGKETLVFKSTENKFDTIFLKGFEQYSAGSDPLAFFPDKHEIYRLKSIVSDPNYDRYLNGKSIIELTAGQDETIIWFDILMKESRFYGKYIYSKTEFDSVPISSLNIDSKTYDDVKIFESDGSYEQRDNYTERFYWSLSQGFLGLDKRETEWRLIKKYVP